VRHRGCDAGRATRALSHPALAPGTLQRSLSRVVGRRATGHRKSGAGAGNLHAQGRFGGLAPAAADARQYCLRPCQSAQALHPNGATPADSSLVDSGRRARFDKESYAAWLKRLREVCTKRNIVLIFDEVFVGFRLAPGGAQEYFGVRADLVTYGKTVGGGFPIGVLCGRKDLMKRFRDDRPADICFARGTFNSHPVVMGAMNEFLQLLDTPEIKKIYRNLDTRWNERAARLNKRLREESLPVQVASMSSIWTVCYTRPSRYNWMFQYYLRAEGLALS